MCQSGQEQPTRPKFYKKKDRQPRNADKRANLSHMVSNEKIHISNFIQIVQVIVRIQMNIHIYMCINEQLMKKETVHLKESK